MKEAPCVIIVPRWVEDDGIEGMGEIARERTKEKIDGMVSDRWGVCMDVIEQACVVFDDIERAEVVLCKRKRGEVVITEQEDTGIGRGFAEDVLAATFGRVGTTVQLIVIELGVGALGATRKKSFRGAEVQTRPLMGDGEQAQAAFEQNVKGCALLAEACGDGLFVGRECGVCGG